MDASKTEISTSAQTSAQHTMNTENFRLTAIYADKPAVTSLNGIKLFEANITKILTHARNVAKLAVESDISHRYSDCLSQYRVLFNTLDDAIYSLQRASRNLKLLPEPKSDLNTSKLVIALESLLKKYIQRVNLILSLVKLESSDYYSCITILKPDTEVPKCDFSIQNTSDIINVLVQYETCPVHAKEQLPADHYNKLFQFLGRISTSMTIGVVLMDGLFVSPLIWNQLNVISNPEEKSLTYIELTLMLKKLSPYQNGFVSDMDKFGILVDEFENLIEVSTPVFLKRSGR